jgi:hypothetical protein
MEYFNLMLYTVDCQISSIQLAGISNKIYHFYLIIQKEVCDAHMFICHVVVLAITIACITHSHAITLEAS